MDQNKKKTTEERIICKYFGGYFSFYMKDSNRYNYEECNIKYVWQLKQIF